MPEEMNKCLIILRFLQKNVRIAEMDVANVSLKWRENEGNDGLLHVWSPLCGQLFKTFKSFLGAGMRGRVEEDGSYFIDC